MINKIVQGVAEAMTGIRDGAIVLIGGFGSIGQPNALIEGLIEHGAKDLTVVSNNAGVGHTGLARLLEAGRVRKMVCSYPRTSDPVVFETLYREGRIELEVIPQGTMAERMRAAGAGIAAFYTPTSVGTKLAEGKEEREFSGRRYVLEEALPGDVALIEAWEADRWGNLTYISSARNFGSDAISMRFGVQVGPINLACRRSIFALPYIWRLTSLSLVMCPSVWPFDQGSVMAAWTAALSLRMPLAKEAIRLALAVAIQGSRSAASFWRSMAWNRSTNMRASTRMGTRPSMAAIVTVSALLR